MRTTMGDFGAGTDEGIEPCSVNKNRRLRGNRNSRCGARVCGVSIAEILKLTVLGVLIGLIISEISSEFFYSDKSSELHAGRKQSVSGRPLSAVIHSSSTSSITEDSLRPSNTHAPTPELTNIPVTPSPTVRPTNGCLEGLEKGYSASRYNVEDAKVFIMQDDEWLSTEHMLQCFVSLALGSSGNGDKSAMPILRIAELQRAANAPSGSTLSFVLNDLMLLDGLKRHPSRVYNPKDANIVVPDFLPHLSSELPPHSVLSELCPDWEQARSTHEERMTEAHARIRSSYPWKLGKERFAFIHSQPLGKSGTPTTITRKLLEDIVLSRAMVMTSSAAFLKGAISKLGKKVRSKEAFFEQKLVPVPLLPSAYSLEQSEITPSVKISARPYPIFFNDIIKQRKLAARIHDISYKFENGKINPKERPGVLDPEFVRVKEMARAQTCMVMDFTIDGNAGLQVLYDAIEAGCMPIFLFGRKEVALPFSHSLDWSRAAVFANGGMQCLVVNLFDIIVLKESLLTADFAEARLKFFSNMAVAFKFPDSIIDYREWSTGTAGEVDPEEEVIAEEEVEEKEAEEEEAEEEEAEEEEAEEEEAEEEEAEEEEAEEEMEKESQQDERLGRLHALHKEEAKQLKKNKNKEPEVDLDTETLASRHRMPEELQQPSNMLDKLIIELALTATVIPTYPPFSTPKTLADSIRTAPEPSKRKSRKRGLVGTDIFQHKNV